jgi:hypothetical protein
VVLVDTGTTVALVDTGTTVVLVDDAPGAGALGSSGGAGVEPPGTGSPAGIVEPPGPSPKLGPPKLGSVVVVLEVLVLVVLVLVVVVLVVLDVVDAVGGGLATDGSAPDGPVEPPEQPGAVRARAAAQSPTAARRRFIAEVVAQRRGPRPAGR